MQHLNQWKQFSFRQWLLDYNNLIFVGNMKLQYTILYLIILQLPWFRSCEMNPCILIRQGSFGVGPLDVRKRATPNNNLYNQVCYLFWLGPTQVHLFFQFRKWKLPVTVEKLRRNGLWIPSMKEKPDRSELGFLTHLIILLGTGWRDKINFKLCTYYAQTKNEMRCQQPCTAFTCECNIILTKFEKTKWENVL